MSSNFPTLADVPQHLANRMQAPSALTAAIAGGLTGEAMPRISIKGSKFRMIEGGAETLLPTTKLSAIIVGANPGVSKLWYEKAWTPETEDNTAPDCFSFDGVSPHIESKNPQNEACAKCAHNAWGSKLSESGAKSKECADQKRLAIVSADAPEGPVYLLQVTPSALKNLNNYQKELRVRGIAGECIKTLIGFDPEASHPKLTFVFGGFIEEDVQPIVDKLFGSDEVMVITGELEGVAQGVSVASLPSPSEQPAAPVVTKKAAKAEKPAPTPPVVAEQAAEPDVPTPEVATQNELEDLLGEGGFDDA